MTARSQRDETGMAMFVVLLCLMVSAALVTAVLAVVSSEIGPTAHQRKAARTIAAAEAGLQAGLGALRTATRVTSSGVIGDVTRLPCADGTPLTGTVGGAPGNARWSLRVRYYSADPTDRDAGWRDTNAVACHPGFGPVAVPSFALLEAAGTADAASGVGPTWGDRSQSVVYTFSRSDANRAGGLMRTSGYGGTRDLCWAVASLAAPIGSPVSLASCDQVDGRQSFSYRSDYSLVLSATQTSFKPPAGGLCLTGIPSGASTTVVASLNLQPCDGRPAQVWAFDVWGRFVMKRFDGSAMSSTCVSAPSVSAAVLAPGDCSASPRWSPDAEVGAGAAGPQTEQLVNYQEFGRCLDITGWNLDHRFLIDYPCKQNPLGPADANQQWVYDPLTRKITSRYGGGYCLTTAAAAGGYVTTTPCSDAAAQSWTVRGETGARLTSYTILDVNGRCLGIGPPNTTEGAGTAQWSTIVVSACDGRLGQKWNAPPAVTAAGADAQRETTNGR